MTTIEQYHEEFFAKYKKWTLNKGEVAEILGRSETWLNRRLAANDLDSIPKFKRLGNGPKSPYAWPIHAVAEFMAEVTA